MQTNRFEISGCVATAPFIRELPSGAPVANVRIAQTFLYGSHDKREKHTNWFNAVFYGSLSTVAMSFEKGDNVNIVGSLQQRQITPKAGATRTVYEVVVSKCHRIAGLRMPESSIPVEGGVAMTPDGTEAQSPAIRKTDEILALF